MTPTEPTLDPRSVTPSSSPPSQVAPLPEVDVTAGAVTTPVVPAGATGKEVDGGPRMPVTGDQKTPVEEDSRALSTTRAAAAWLATAVSLVILVLLIILILENQQTVSVTYLGLNGSLPLGTALLIAAVAGGAIVTIVGVIRLTQLRMMARRARRREATRLKATKG